MRIIRWLFGRSSLNRIDAPMILLIVLSGAPIWAIGICLVLWLAISTCFEVILFGEGYHEASSSCQEVAENWRDVPDNS